MIKTKVINLYGGPGIGKSTTAMNLCGLLKSNHINAELVREYVKNWIWEERTILESDQLYILAKQHRSERILYGKVNVIVTDSPMWLTTIYEKELSQAPFICDLAINKFLKESEHIAEHYHILLNRVHPYQTEGRVQDEEEAKLIDQKIKKFLIDKGEPFISIDADKNAEKLISDQLKLIK